MAKYGTYTCVFVWLMPYLPSLLKFRCLDYVEGLEAVFTIESLKYINAIYFLYHSLSTLWKVMKYEYRNCCFPQCMVLYPFVTDVKLVPAILIRFSEVQV